MIDMFVSKRGHMILKSQQKNILPEIKQGRGNPSNNKKSEQHYNIKGYDKFTHLYQQPLSSLLVSKRIEPTLFHSEYVSPQMIRRKKNNMPSRPKQRDQVVTYNYLNVESLIGKSQIKRITTAFSQKTARVLHKQQILEEDQLPKNIKVSKSDQLTFLIDKANNNEDLIRKILEERKIWKEVKWGECIPNFKWLFVKQKNNYKKMNKYQQIKCVNHYQYNEQITTKDLLIKNLQIYCQTKKIQLFTLTPVTFIIDFDDEYCEYNMKQFLNFFFKNDPRKNNKRTNSQNYQTSFNFVNKFGVYMEWQNSQLKKNINNLSKPINNVTFNTQSSYIWLLKPTGLNRGRGIQIFDSIQHLQTILINYMTLMNRKNISEKSKSREALNPQMQNSSNLSLNVGESKISSEKFKLNTCSFVIQKYVEKPFLIDGRKFDIRVWVLLTHKLKLYIFKEGYIRTSTQLFSTEDINNYFIHLTNNAIQKNSENYGQYENGNQLSFKQLSKYIPQSSRDLIWEKIKQISYMTFSSVKRKINQNQRKNCFEIFGLDYIIDEELKVWLIQVNENPCIECASSLLSQLIPRMINDAFKLTIDQIFGQKSPSVAYYPVDGYSNKQNLWDDIGVLTPNAEYMCKKNNQQVKI